KHKAAGIPTWSPTVVLICRSTAYVWQSGRDAQFSADCGRMCKLRIRDSIYLLVIVFVNIEHNILVVQDRMLFMIQWIKSLRLPKF
ncbi:uncharacterized protein M437DRAFT_48178, partial [Aureobasidium melanogenum CBS 110374]